MADVATNIRGTTDAHERNNSVVVGAPRAAGADAIGNNYIIRAGGNFATATITFTGAATADEDHARRAVWRRPVAGQLPRPLRASAACSFAAGPHPPDRACDSAPRAVPATRRAGAAPSARHPQTKTDPAETL